MSRLGRKINTCSGHNHDTTVSCSTWGKKNPDAWFGKKGLVGWEGEMAFATEGSTPLPNSLQRCRTAVAFWESASAGPGTQLNTSCVASRHWNVPQCTVEKQRNSFTYNQGFVTAPPPPPPMQIVPFPAPSPLHTPRKAWPHVCSLLGAAAAVGGVGSGAEVVQQVQSAFCSLDRAEMPLLLLLTLLGSPEKGQGQFRNVTVFSLLYLSRATACLFDPWP